MYNIVRTQQFEDDIAALRPQFPRLDDALDGVETALAHNPQCRPMVFVDYGIRSISLGEWPNVPKAHIYYQDAKDEVRLLYIQIASDVDDDSEFEDVGLS